MYLSSAKFVISQFIMKNYNYLIYYKEKPQPDPVGPGSWGVKSKPKGPDPV